MKVEEFTDFESCDLKEFISKYDGITDQEILIAIWRYGNNQWSKGFDQGKHNPDFD